MTAKTINPLRQTFRQTLNCEPACTRQVRRVVSDGPGLSCPLQGECLWDAHPRVYLTFDGEGSANCPYCNTRYIIDTTQSKKYQHDGIDT